MSSSLSESEYMVRAGTLVVNSIIKNVPAVMNLRYQDLSLPFSDFFGSDHRPFIVRRHTMFRVILFKNTDISDHHRIDPNTSLLDMFIDWSDDILLARRFMDIIPPTPINLVWVLKNITDDTYAQDLTTTMLTYPSVYVSVWTSLGENDISFFSKKNVYNRFIKFVKDEKHPFLQRFCSSSTCKACFRKIKSVYLVTVEYCSKECMQIE
ncbi:hypothetical protein TetV_209 [Tetraselmis virus 1]|uniref:Uncharacterized protein n=1 Tax=Tetraselmis virus 1 TaxID=2060617 RepID=A0A2P0VN28_9VIRU|nr:hypothetical protein QJ968_gp209 [Tetraselmis virus 1]AUF82301.1 hypothetical protein TetV_209 [Tetraselmis virus 1]